MYSTLAASFAGDFSCIRAELHLRRQIGYFGVQVYVPSASIVGISWISFWLDVDAVPARISLNLLAVLTMTTQFSSVRDKLPSVIYITALDIWMSVCLLFVICSLVEFALVNVLVRQQVKQVGKVSKRQRLSKHSDSTNNVETIVEKVRHAIVLYVASPPLLKGSGSIPASPLSYGSLGVGSNTILLLRSFILFFIENN